MQISQYAGHRNRMRDVRLTGFTHDTLMGFVGITIAFKYLLYILGFEILLETNA